ncbi:hypothetical protein H9W95_14990 [Flavobacterium lindanitolerans]|nr:hypothetical protein [Flavobacterium lindanitolerans]
MLKFKSSYKKGYAFFDQNKPYNVNIIGIRSKNTVANSFDDTLCLVYRDESLSPQIFTFSVTTDPGLYWLKNPTNVNGTAILVRDNTKVRIKLDSIKANMKL